MTEQPRTDADEIWTLPFIYGATDDGAVHHSVLARTSIVDGRRVIDGLVIIAPDITAATLRAIPIGLLSAWVAQAQSRNWVVNKPNKGAALTAAIEDASEPTHIGVTQQQGRPPLTRPDGTDPEGFSRRVAEAYSDAVLWTSTPAKVLAAEAAVPVTTVHRWIRDARRLGLLPPARKGRAG